MAELGVESNGIKSFRPRLHYLDWLRVLAILMVFLFHAVHPLISGIGRSKTSNRVRS